MSFDQSTFDPGLTQQYSGNILRMIEKDGSFNVKKKGGGLKNVHFFQFLINISWARFLLLVLLGYLAVNAFFACLYIAAGVEHLRGAETGSPLAGFLSAFFFSVHTFTTVGYGTIAPISFMTNLIAALEALTGLMALALATGLLYGRFSRPSARLAFSENALVAPYHGQQGLEFRLANKRANVLVDLNATVILMTVVNVAGGQKRKYEQLRLERSSVYFLALTWTIVHPIDENSPLHGKSRDELAAMQAEILILVRAFDDTFSQVVHSRYSYRYDEIVWGARFLPSFHVTDAGGLDLELGRLGDFEPADR